MWYLGWDCANRTLAFVLMKFDKSELDACLAECEEHLAGKRHVDATELRSRARKIIEIRHAQVADILGDNIKSFSYVELARKLGDFLENSPVSAQQMRDLAPRVIIEYQPPKLAKWGGATTEQASTIAHQLMFYYRDFDAIYIDSKEKNKIAFASTLMFDRYLAGCDTDSRKKTARKKHTTDNFLYIVENFHCEYGAIIKKSLTNHAADACMQIFACIRNQK